MRNYINIGFSGYSFPYLLEYNKNAPSMDGSNSISSEAITLIIDKNNTVRLFNDDVHHYKQNNEWYSIDNLEYDNENKDKLPNNCKTSALKLYIPTHCISKYLNNVKYAVSVNTWINGYKIDLGAYIFRPTDTLALHNGSIKKGNNEYYEYIEFDIIDPFELIYSDSWKDFREKICGEKSETNYNVSNLYVSLYAVNECDNNHYILYNDCIGGYTNFNISSNDDFLNVKLGLSMDPLGFEFNIGMNSEYTSLIDYFKETYGLNLSHKNFKFDVVLKNKSNIVVSPSTICALTEDEDILNENKTTSKLIAWEDFTNISNDLISKWFSDWNNYEEGWSIVGSLTVYNEKGEEIISFVSNEILVTQDVFSMLTNSGSEKIIDLTDMEIHTYNIVNKIQNNIIHVDKPSESKSNIIQPVFFKVNSLELLTLHPDVTENISINLDNYKSKVERFTLKIGNCLFEQIGANNYGILFKIKANMLPNTLVSGTYYVLDENKELVTTGKYNCVR